jgi:hypothetical protein
MNVPIPGLTGLYFGSVAWADYDNDGWSDFLITGAGHTGDPVVSQLWRNTGSTFTNVPIDGLRGVVESASAWADFDNDGLMDFIITGITTNGLATEIWRNSGSSFERVQTPDLPPFTDGSVACADYDNDGLVDFIVTGISNGGAANSQVWKKAVVGFSHISTPEISGSYDGSLAWGDFDGDGRLDLLIAGQSAGIATSRLWRNIFGPLNSRPAAPNGLAAHVAGRDVEFTWLPPMDDHTPAGGLTYNIRVGTSPGASDILAAPALPNGMLLTPKEGITHRQKLFLKNLSPGQTYYWSVQAVDSGFAGSQFAEEHEFTVPPTLNITAIPNDGGTLIQFTNRASMNFSVFASTNIAGSAEQWTQLGAPISIGNGVFQFTDGGAKTNQSIFYRLQN